jgi:predicted porin
MKKSLVALAVLAASGASFAQSSVTAYGLLDLWVGSSKAADASTTVVTDTLSKTSMGSGGVDTSRWGLKGSEDLGGGLKANFKLEQGFALDTGAANTLGSGVGVFGINNTTATVPSAAFSRYAYVGFSGGFGEVKLGKTATAYDEATGGGNAVFNSALSAEANTWKTNNDYNWNPANTILYFTPDMGGFSAAVSYSLGENKSATVEAGNITAFNLAYSGGPIYAAVAYQSEKADGAANSVKYTQINGSYDLGVAKLKAAYGNVTNDVAPLKTTEYQFGVDFPVSAALTLSANYAQSKDDAVGTTAEAKRSGFGFAGAYSLSKRTYVYGGFRSETNDQAGAGDLKTGLVAVGVHHLF